MKIRMGFVSNSSVSSFLIYGTAINYEQYKKLSNMDEEPQLYRGECGDHYIGTSWDEILDEETGLQFKNKVKQQIEILLGHSVECSTIDEAYYNG